MTVRERLWAWRWPLAVVLITGAGLAIRVCKAWAMRYAGCNGDFSVIGLMAKHMAEGGDYPVFAYGVGYMGSLEPALTALLARVAGVEVTAFLVNLSPALVGTALLPLLYLFGRDAGSPRAGVLAMLYCLVGPDTLLHYSAAPRGGYMNLMVAGLLTLWLACRIATAERRGESPSRWAYLGLGLAAGVAWWVTQLAVVFLLAASLVLLVGFRWAMVRRGLAPALAGVLLGSLPWWGWNITHHWESLSFGGSEGQVPFAQGVLRFGQHILWLLEMSPLVSWRGAPRLLLLIGLVFVFVWLLLRDWYRKECGERFFFRVGVVFLCVSLGAVYCTSSFALVHATRYVLPLLPAVAVMAAVACDRLLCRSRLPWALLGFVLVVPPHILLLPKMFDDVPRDRARWEAAAQLEKEIAPQCDGVFVGDFYQTHWINFASREKLCVAALPRERYASYARRVELAERPAYLDGCFRLSEFLAGTRGASRQSVVVGFRVDYALTPPSREWRYVAPGDIAAVQDGQGRDCRRAISGEAADAPWCVRLGAGDSEVLTVSFGRPVRLAGVRLQGLDGCYSQKVAIEGRQGGEGPWLTLLPATRMTPWFWSGPYVTIEGVQYLQELRCIPREAGIDEVRLAFVGRKKDVSELRLAQILFLEAAGPGTGAPGEGWDARESSTGSVSSCADALRREGVARYYAPRWLAERLFVALSNSVPTLIPSLFTRTLHETAEVDSMDPYPLHFTETTGLFMYPRDVPRTREVLRRAELAWREVAVGDLTLLVVDADRPSLAGAGFPRAFWTEHGCLGVGFRKDKAQGFHEAALRQTGASNGAARRAGFARAIEAYPAHAPAREALVAELAASGASAEASSNAAVLRATAQPATPCHVRFGNGVELLGVTVGEGKPETLAKAGQIVPISYYWKCPADVDPERWEAFVHVKAGGTLFQDDHVLLSAIQPLTRRYQLFPEVFVEHRQLAIPRTEGPRDYRVWIGLVERASHRRVSADAARLWQRNAVELPVSIVVN